MSLTIYARSSLASILVIVSQSHKPRTLKEHGKIMFLQHAVSEGIPCLTHILTRVEIGNAKNVGVKLTSDF